MGSDNYLCISDTQHPYEAKNALKFCKYVQKFFKIPKENIIHVGDEVDSFHASSYPKGADYPHTPGQELQEAVDKLKAWYDAFPICRVAISNHMLRWQKKASEAQIPSQLMKSHKEIIQAPNSWQWFDEIIIKTKHPFKVIHGTKYSGNLGHRNAAIDNGMSTAIGHLHSFAGVNRIKTTGLDIWAMNTGCLIDTEAYVFKYGEDSRFKPTLGVGVVLNNGLMPIWVPYE